MLKIWSCKIGEVDEAKLRAAYPEGGADAPMRDAVREAYRQLTGEYPAFLFSGWGAELDEHERAAVHVWGAARENL
jgi:hypothetical protein